MGRDEVEWKRRAVEWLGRGEERLDVIVEKRERKGCNAAASGKDEF